MQRDRILAKYGKNGWAEWLAKEKAKRVKAREDAKKAHRTVSNDVLWHAVPSLF